MSASLGVRLRRYWVAGILVLAPTALTLWVVWKLFKFFDDILGGELRARGISVVGLGFVLLNVLLLLLGFVAANFLGKRLFALWDRLMHRVPLINKIYATLRQIAELLLGPAARRLLRPRRDRRVPVAGDLGPRLRDVDGRRRGRREDGPEALQPLHSERRQPDDGIPPRRARGEGDLPRHDAGAGDEDDRLGRRAASRRSAALDLRRPQRLRRFPRRQQELLAPEHRGAHHPAEEILLAPRVRGAAAVAARLEPRREPDERVEQQAATRAST